jgi:hypothetical protein
VLYKRRLLLREKPRDLHVNPSLHVQRPLAVKGFAISSRSALFAVVQKHVSLAHDFDACTVPISIVASNASRNCRTEVTILGMSLKSYLRASSIGPLQASNFPLAYAPAYAGFQIIWVLQRRTPLGVSGDMSDSKASSEVLRKASMT